MESPPNTKNEADMSPKITHPNSNYNSDSSNDNPVDDDANGSTRRFRILIPVVAVLVFLGVAVGIGLVVMANRASSSSNSGNNNDNVLASLQQRGSPAETETPTLRPSSRPSLQPTLAPTSQPSLRPSSIPSATPSVIPSATPSATPSTRPSAMPSPNPTASPTREVLPEGFTFRIKMHWERHFFWQEEYVERQWCLECTTCQELTTSGAGEGCVDADKNDGTDCQNGDQLWIQNCNGWAGGSRGNTDFEIVRGPVADQLKIRRRNLCLTRASSVHLDLQRCDETNIRQLWTGFQLDRPFDLRPLEQNLHTFEYDDPVQVRRCLSQHHHPKAGEILYLVDCDLAHYWHTALWEPL